MNHFNGVGHRKSPSSGELFGAPGVLTRPNILSHRCGSQIDGDDMPFKALALNCTLKADETQESSTDAMIAVLKDAFAAVEVEITETVRVAALDIKPGVTSDEGDGDEWPELRSKILAHDILIFGGPIWMGQIGSVAKRVLERMDAFLDETDDQGRISRLRSSFRQ
jgi:multimeric flavodoxin WrbA